MRLIDVDELAKHEHWKEIVRSLELAPTIEAVPVVHSKIIRYGNDLICSRCGHIIPYDVNEDEDTVDYWKCNYCLNCGAKMDLRK